MNRKLKSRASRSHEEATVESFRHDPAFAADYLNAILEDGDQDDNHRYPQTQACSNAVEGPVVISVAHGWPLFQRKSRNSIKHAQYTVVL
jgi:hypothetical protein